MENPKNAAVLRLFHMFCEKSSSTESVKKDAVGLPFIARLAPCDEG
jgi:hypothetical protein